MLRETFPAPLSPRPNEKWEAFPQKGERRGGFPQFGMIQNALATKSNTFWDSCMTEMPDSEMHMEAGYTKRVG